MIKPQSEVDVQVERGQLKGWPVQAYRELLSKVGDESFPCTFGTLAAKKKQIFLAFIESTDPRVVTDRLVEVLTEFAEFIRPLPLVEASMRPLAILLLPPPEWLTIEDYYHHSWRLVAEVMHRDPDPWPDRIPSDPELPDWSFCFGGVPFFINFKTPHHERRRSRRSLHAYTWLVQAREGFDLIAGDTVQGRAARHVIRKKLSSYDQMPIFPALNHYGRPDNLEWKQYFVPEGHQPITDKCPLSMDSRTALRG